MLWDVSKSWEYFDRRRREHDLILHLLQHYIWPNPVVLRNSGIVSGVVCRVWEHSQRARQHTWRESRLQPHLAALRDHAISLQPVQVEANLTIPVDRFPRLLWWHRKHVCLSAGYYDVTYARNCDVQKYFEPSWSNKVRVSLGKYSR